MIVPLRTTVGHNLYIDWFACRSFVYEWILGDADRQVEIKCFSLRKRSVMKHIFIKNYSTNYNLIKHVNYDVEILM